MGAVEAKDAVVEDLAQAEVARRGHDDVRRGALSGPGHDLGHLRRACGDGCSARPVAGRRRQGQGQGVPSGAAGKSPVAHPTRGRTS